MRPMFVRLCMLSLCLTATALLGVACDDGDGDPDESTDMTVDATDTSMPPTDTSMPQDTSVPQDTSTPDTSTPDTTDPGDTVADTDADPDMMMRPAGTCADPFVLTTGELILEGSDFAADFGDAIELSDASCALGDDGGDAKPDVIVQVDLSAGDTVAVAEFGAMDSVRNVLAGFCDDNSLCPANLDDPEEEALVYTATVDETIWIQVSSYFAAPAPSGDYYIQVSLNPECGNGVTEANESCDDANATDNDGCEACQLVGPFECDTIAEPTVCTGYPDLGSYGANETVPTQTGGPLPSGEFELYRIEFTERVSLSGMLSSDTGDMDFYLLDYDFNEVLVPYLEGDDVWQDEVIEAGLYIVALNAWEGDADAQNWTLDMSTASIGVCGDGATEAGESCDDANTVPDDGCDACVLRGAFDCDTTTNPTTCTALPSIGMLDVGDMAMHTGGPLLADTSDLLALTTNAPLALSGSLTFTTGDADLYIYDEEFNLRHQAADIGPEALVDIPLPAGTWIIEVYAYPDDGDVDSYTLSLTAAALTDMGTLDVGATVTAMSTGALPEGSSTGRLLTTAVPLRVDATVSGGTTGAPRVDVETADGTYLSSGFVFWGTSGAAEPFTWLLPAGTYLVTVRPQNLDDMAADDVDAWSLSLTGATPAPTDGGSFGAGATVGPLTGGPLSAGTSDFVDLTFDAAVVFDGTLTGASGDVDLTVRDAATLEPVESAAAVGDEMFSFALPAGSYTVEILAWPQDGDVSTWTLQGTTTAAP